MVNLGMMLAKAVHVPLRRRGDRHHRICVAEWVDKDEMLIRIFTFPRFSEMRSRRVKQLSWILQRFTPQDHYKFWQDYYQSSHNSRLISSVAEPAWR